ncbi:acetyl-CoA carboxylase carboxyl transferase subunit alpha, partial [candidate division KSB1 bacterium]
MVEFTLEFEKPIVELEEKINEMKALSAGQSGVISEEIARLESKLYKLMDDTYSRLNRWQRVQLARHPMRPYSLDYIERIFTDFIELHGDRQYRDDPALVAGLAKLDGRSVMVLGQQKGRTTKEKLFRNFGMMHPEGYRKALRLMKMADKFKRPIIVFVDTPGAYPGVGAEERGQGEAIARNLFEMSVLKVPIIVVIIAEGASGGALGIGVGDRVYMLENSWYSVISPEGCAAILWRD